MKTANEIAQEMMLEADGDVLEATAMLEELARQDVEVWQAVTDGLLRTACYDACRSICRSERRTIWHTSGYDAGGNGERIKSHSSSLMEWPLPGGKRMRDATKQDLIDAAGFYAMQASQMAAVSDWLGRVASKVKSKTVGETLTDKQLRTLRDDTSASQRIAA